MIEKFNFLSFETKEKLQKALEDYNKKKDFDIFRELIRDICIDDTKDIIEKANISKEIKNHFQTLLNILEKIKKHYHYNKLSLSDLVKVLEKNIITIDEFLIFIYYRFLAQVHNAKFRDNDNCDLASNINIFGDREFYLVHWADETFTKELILSSKQILFKEKNEKEKLININKISKTKLDIKNRFNPKQVKMDFDNLDDEDFNYKNLKTNQALLKYLKNMSDETNVKQIQKSFQFFDWSKSLIIRDNFIELINTLYLIENRRFSPLGAGPYYNDGTSPYDDGGFYRGWDERTLDTFGGFSYCGDHYHYKHLFLPSEEENKQLETEFQAIDEPEITQSELNLIKYNQENKIQNYFDKWYWIYEQKEQSKKGFAFCNPEYNYKNFYKGKTRYINYFSLIKDFKDYFSDNKIKTIENIINFPYNLCKIENGKDLNQFLYFHRESNFIPCKEDVEKVKMLETKMDDTEDADEWLDAFTEWSYFEYDKEKGTYEYYDDIDKFEEIKIPKEVFDTKTAKSVEELIFMKKYNKLYEKSKLYQQLVFRHICYLHFNHIKYIDYQTMNNLLTLKKDKVISYFEKEYFLSFDELKDKLIRLYKTNFDDFLKYLFSICPEAYDKIDILPQYNDFDNYIFKFIIANNIECKGLIIDTYFDSTEEYEFFKELTVEKILEYRNNFIKNGKNNVFDNYSDFKNIDILNPSNEKISRY
ncbi:hypothetical protein [Campylobacter canadensis]|uniref:hypothetical protein n=1 Tax=Campylobacter canadensis TaxID=449520 RepID=UPI001CCECB06|nr:hypothetical protein [Campylobacter canadensis]MBZ8002363.1 hypothetical protein [Campylobacter canadensis]